MSDYLTECKHLWDMIETFNIPEAAALWCGSDPASPDIGDPCFSIKKRVLEGAIRNRRLPYTIRGRGVRVSRNGWEEDMSLEELIEENFVIIDRTELSNWFEQLPHNDRPAFLFEAARHTPMPDNRPDATNPYDDQRQGENRRIRERVRTIAELYWDSNPTMTIEDFINLDVISKIACERVEYNGKTIRNWIKDLNPNKGKPGRRSTQKQDIPITSPWKN